eukprot:gene22724-31009_t
MAGTQSLMVDIVDAIENIINPVSLEETLHALDFLRKGTANETNSKLEKKSNNGTSFNALLTKRVEEIKPKFFSELKKLLIGRNRNLAPYSVILFGNLASLSPSIQDAIGECGAIETLIELLFSRDHQYLMIHIVEALSKIANGSEKNQARILDSGRVADLVPLMRNEQLRGPTVKVITKLCKNNVGSQRAVAEAGAIPALKELLAESHANPAAGQNADGLIQALGAIVGGNPANQQAARLAGCIPQILRFMTNSESEWVRAATVETLGCLFYGCPENKAEVLKHGGVAALTGLLKDKSVEVRQNSSCALKSLFKDYPAALVAFREGEKERTMETLCQMLWDQDADVLQNVLEALCVLAEGGQSLHGVLGRLRDLRKDGHTDIRKLAARAISVTEQQQQRGNEAPSSAFLEDSDLPPPQPRLKKRPAQAATSK